MIMFTCLDFLIKGNIIWEDITNKIDVCVLLFQEEDSVLIYLTLVRKVVNTVIRHQC